MKKQMIFLTIAMLFSGLAMAFEHKALDIDPSDFEVQANHYGSHEHSNPYEGPKTGEVQGMYELCGKCSKLYVQDMSNKPECDQLVGGLNVIDSLGSDSHTSYNANYCEELLR